MRAYSFERGEVILVAVETFKLTQGSANSNKLWKPLAGVGKKEGLHVGNRKMDYLLCEQEDAGHAN